MKRVDFDYYFPADFFNKKINEQFNLFMIMSCLGISNECDIRFGEPNKNEPDLIIDGCAYELTLASDNVKFNNYIKQVKEHTLSVENIEAISVECIKNACQKKSKKRYFISNITLSIVLTMPVYLWAAKTYSHIGDLLPQTQLPQLLNDLKTQYITKGYFKDILLHMPGYAYDWISYSCLNEIQIKHTKLTNDEIIGRQFPYVKKRIDI